VIGVSHQGRTRDLIEMLSLAKSFGATTIAITAVPQSPLATVATIALYVLTPEVARAGTFLIAFDTLMVLADILSAAVADRRWNGQPPHRREVVEWIETHLRVGPMPQLQQQSRTRRSQRNNRGASDGATNG
jgi:DNA-binding MurR/RpiR family transcriptional regulator